MPIARPTMFASASGELKTRSSPNIRCKPCVSLKTPPLPGTSDSASLASAPSSNAFSQSYSVSNGTGTPGRGTITANGVTKSIFYIISASKIVTMDVMDNTGAPNRNPAITTGRQ